MSGVKHDEGKVRLELLPPEALEEIAVVMGFGAKKYGDHNWRGGIAYSRVFGACLRHLWAWWRGEDKDPESGRTHLAHASCCLLFLMTYEIYNKNQDDRYRRENTTK